MKLDEVLRFDPDNSFDKLHALVQSIPDSYVETTSDVVEYLNHQAEQAGLNITFRETEFPSGPTNYGAVGIGGGWYDPNTDTVIVDVLSSFWSKLQKNERRVIQVLYQLYVHEKTHQQQVRAAGKKHIFKDLDTDNETEYLSAPHEIQALASEIIAELTSQGVTADNVLDALRRGDKEVLFKSDRFMQYVTSRVTRKTINRLYKTLIQMLSKES